MALKMLTGYKALYYNAYRNKLYVQMEDQNDISEAEN